MNPIDKPQMLEYIQQPVNYTVYDTKWLPVSAKFVVLGSKANGRGVIEIYELDEAKCKKLKEIDKKSAFKCGTFNASNLRTRHMAVGDFDGQLQVLDLERPDIPVYSVEAHKEIINAIDGMGGKQIDCGPPEILTGGRDGSVKVWDIRQGGKPVVDMSPSAIESGSGDSKQNCKRDCWAVAFGDSFSNSDRAVAAGYDNGDLKLFDLRAMSVRWETTLKNGICGIEFDRRDIPMNKMTVVTLEGGLLVFDMRTQHAKHGFAFLEERNAGRSVGSNGIITGPRATVWCARHLPQNRELFVTCGGTGSVRLWNYEYPEKRRIDADDGALMGAMGSLHMLAATTVSTQPVHCLDWNADKMGLAVCGAFDQTVRVIITTKMNLYS